MDPRQSDLRALDEFDFARWELTPDGDPIATHSSVLYPVRRYGRPAMLKIANGEEEARGAATMVWWNGEGAAKVLAQEGNALLLERAEGRKSLIDMARTGRDDEATRIICTAAAHLHAPRGQPLPVTLVPLARWLEALPTAAAPRGGILSVAAGLADALLATPGDLVVLHGDIHHGNILDFGPRG